MSQDQDNASKTTNKKPENSDIVNKTEPAAKLASVQKPVTKPAPSTNTLTKKEAEPPAFEKGIVDKLVKAFGSKINVIYVRPLRMKIMVEPPDILATAMFLRDNLGFDHAESVAGTDYPKDNQIEVIYHLGSYGTETMEGHIMALATRTPRNDARLPSLIDVFRSVEYHERETFEMLGVYFEGHPRNERFLLPEDWADIPPLRREFRIKGR
ncbi:MAG: NADH-quinone oxidoreductase subunit C [Thermoproteota archaeon]|nr:NADH-quinone oxidoreductase subunit C [Thermoproteota archaeon]